MSERFLRTRLAGSVKPCVTCGRPVEWMAQHRACWQWERAHGITAETVRRIARMKARAA